MTLLARSRQSAHDGMRASRAAATLAARARAWLRRRLGVREFVCGAFGEFLGLQMGVAVGFNLVNGDLVPEAAHHLAWSLSLSLGAIVGGAMGWWVARMTREEPQRARVK